MFNKIVIATLAVAGIGIASFAAGCGDSGGGDACSAFCDCESAVDNCADSCQAAIDAGSKAAGTDCADEYTADIDCIYSNGTCANGVYTLDLTTSKCDTENKAYAACVSGGTTTTSTGTGTGGSK